MIKLGPFLFISGIGSCLNSNGDIEMDAVIMDGKSLNTGKELSQLNFISLVHCSSFQTFSAVPDFFFSNLEFLYFRWEKIRNNAKCIMKRKKEEIQNLYIYKILMVIVRTMYWH